MLSKKEILSIDVSTGSNKDFVDAIITHGKNRVSSYVCFCNVHMLVTARLKPTFKQVVNNADIVAPDGKPIVKCLDLFYHLKQDKIDGMNFLPQLLNECSNHQLSVFFIGGDATMLKKNADFLAQHYKRLRIAGMLAPPFSSFTAGEKKEMADTITASGANVVIVILGCPKQEEWMAEMKGLIPAVMLGMGAALPVLLGLKKRAPEWMQKMYIECFYRMYQEPGRLIKRYTVTNSIFLFMLARKLIRHKLFRQA